VLEILQFIFSSFWHFVGVLLLIVHGCNGLALLLQALRKD
jgi:hypothetical protein